MAVEHHRDGTARDRRLADHRLAAAELALLGDDELAARVAAAGVTGTGIGGVTTGLTVAGARVFVKRIPLTEPELLPEHVRSTANLFDLPPHCQYGVASPGFGAWRELRANLMTTAAVVAGGSEAFPMLHHWRVLSGPPPAGYIRPEVDEEVAFWGGSPQVRRRLKALASAPASLVLFVEHVPHQLGEWLAGPVAAGGDELAAACRMLERGLLDAVAGLQAAGLHHFDGHLGNLLTDGERVYLGDLGLAVSERFDLSAAEREFLERNATHDAAYARMTLVNWLVRWVVGVAVPAEGGPVERNAHVRRYAAGERPQGVSAEVADMIVRHAPVAAVLNDFYWALFAGEITTPYPAERIEALLAPSTS
ncbi:serine/threonine protein phosphatase [Catellatospora sp. NPDC049609]|uniref:serine/threonine protein phosphatase n=1 Tax=Catellatospora sp. NPDC049609 TaxID=3155505 RepID=UPI003441E9C7